MQLPAGLVVNDCADNPGFGLDLLVGQASSLPIWCFVLLTRQLFTVGFQICQSPTGFCHKT